MGRPRKTTLTREDVLDLRERGYNNKIIGQLHGISEKTVTFIANPQNYEIQKARNAAYRAKKAKAPAKPRTRATEVHDKPEPPHLCRPIEEYMLDWQRVKVEGALPPPDRRDNTGKLLGDPLPERSALAKMRQDA